MNNTELIRRLIAPMARERSREPGDAWDQAERALTDTLDALAQIEEMLSAGQGDDEGSQILPDFEPGWSAVAKVEACLHLLEVRRDTIDAFVTSTPSSPVSSPSPAGGVREDDLSLGAQLNKAALTIRRIKDAYEKARYQPGDHPIIPHKLDTLMRELDAALSSPATGEVVEALKPFASAADHFDNYEVTPDNSSVLCTVRLADLRRARTIVRDAALNPAPGHGEGGL